MENRGETIEVVHLYNNYYENKNYIDLLDFITFVFNEKNK